MGVSSTDSVTVNLYLLILAGWTLASFLLFKTRAVVLPSFSHAEEKSYATLKETIALIGVAGATTAIFIFIPILISTLGLAFVRSYLIPFSDLFLKMDAVNLSLHFLASITLVVCSLFITSWFNLHLKEKIIGRDSLFSPLHLLKGFGMAICIYPFFLLIHAVAAAIAYSFSNLEWHPQAALNFFNQARAISPLFLIGAMVTITLFAPLIEEFVFRGVVYSALETIIHPFLAIAINAILFAFMHFSPDQGAANYSIIATLFLFGVFSSLLKKKENSLAASIGFHTGFNGISICIALLS